MSEVKEVKSQTVGVATVEGPESLPRGRAASSVDVGLREIELALTNEIGAKEAKQFMASLRATLKDPDLMIQGGTTNCWFVDRLGDLILHDKERFVKVIAEAAQRGEITANYFVQEDIAFEKVGLGSRPLCARVIQRWFRDKLDAPHDGGANEEMIIKSDTFLSGEEYTVIANRKHTAAGTDFSILLSDPKILDRAGCILRWITPDSAEGQDSKHVYHRFVIEDVRDGRVYFREGVKQVAMMGGPKSLLVENDKDGNVIMSISEADFLNNALGVFVQADLAQEKGLQASYYNQSTPFMDASIFVYNKEQAQANATKSPLEDDAYWNFVKSERKKAEKN